MKKIRSCILSILMVAIIIAVFTSCGLDHIEDTNGADNYELQVITDENIRNLDIGSRNVTISENMIGSTVTYSSNCFTGVYEVFFENIITNRYEITVNHARVDAGNFKMVLCLNDEIVHTFKLNELTQTFLLENVKGTLSLRIAGESADFMFDYYVY